MTLRADLQYRIERVDALERLATIKRQFAERPSTPAQRERTPAGPDDVVDTFMDSPDRLSEE